MRELPVPSFSAAAEAGLLIAARREIFITGRERGRIPSKEGSTSPAKDQRMEEEVRYTSFQDASIGPEGCEEQRGLNVYSECIWLMNSQGLNCVCFPAPEGRV